MSNKDLVRYRPWLLIGFIWSLSQMIVVPAFGVQVSTDDLIGNLQSGSTEERVEAADQLGYLPELFDKSVPALIQSLDHSEALVRWHAARALANLGPAAMPAVSTLRNILSDSDETVRIQAAKALGMIGDNSEETVLALTRLVKESEGSVAHTCIHALHHMHDDSGIVVESLGEALDCEEHAVVIAAIEALVERGAASMPAIIDALQNERTAMWACIAIADLGDKAADAVPYLARLLTDETFFQTRLHALLALAEIGPSAEDAVTAIVELAEHTENETEQIAAAYALGSIGAEGGREFLTTALQSEDEFLNMMASWSLARSFPDDPDLVSSAVKRLTEGLGSTRAELRATAVKGLQELNVSADSVVPGLMELANDPDGTVVDNLIDALVSFGKPVVPILGKALADQEKRDVALTALVRLGSDAGAAIQDIVGLLDDEDKVFVASVHLAFAELGPVAAPAVTAINKSIGSDNERVRQSAMFALGRIGPAAKQAREGLKKMIEQGNEFDKLTASWALVRIFPDEQEFLDLALVHLPEGLESSDESVRMECCETLGHIGHSGHATEKTIESLTCCANEDKSSMVRDAARNAIERITKQKDDHQDHDHQDK